MRKFSILTAALALALSVIPSAASAQSLDSILRVVTGASNSVGRSCGSGIYALSCQMSRVTNVTRDIDYVRRQREDVERRRTNDIRMEMIRRQSANRALEAACRAGDAESCSRSREGRDDAIMNAVLNACSAGDQRSCDRVRGMRDQRVANDRRDDAYDYRRDDSRMVRQDVRIDPRTGYRVAR